MSVSELIDVTETIHHGDYRNVRSVTVPRTWAGFVNVLVSSRYAGGATAETLASNKYVAQAFADLLTTGRCEHGWATYVIDGER